MKIKLNINKVIKVALASTLVLGLALTPSIANAKHVHSHHGYRHYRYTRIRHRHHNHLHISLRHHRQHHARHNHRAKGYSYRLSRHSHRHIQHHSHKSAINNNDSDNKDSDNDSYPDSGKNNYDNSKNIGGVIMNSSAQIKRQETEAHDEAVNDINKDRESVGLPDFNDNVNLTHVAQIRARQASNNFTHYDRNGKPKYVEVAKTYGPHSYILGSKSGENLGSSNSGVGDHEETGKSAADDINNSMWNDEKGGSNFPDGGHRQNIEDKDYTELGVGVVYKPSDQTYYMSELFSN